MDNNEASQSPKRSKPVFKNPNGIPVKKGENFASLSQEQRQQYFRQHENKWKKKYNETRGTVTGMQSISRG